ncbi:uncharacterized protein BJ171DRAFT_40212 [Polychytrium aggregatum]|uniref:uncharacterized protein n=1 Tax=Polychytrium aggregatum TaxID=110093 RepID=UPI0022FE8FE8|nr:uncharacterized protein BJ171DRAFT_40212 [Polychytrium aggregatum]KAI9206052.1 hypothetical protein BJ171DRAFT_40212 [Polychytrium aggregatum]
MLQSDINAGFGKHNQWFYFSIEGMMSNVSYKFNIINMSKANSQFNSGMQPVIYSKIDDCWRRIGDNVLYLRNHYRKCPGEKNPNAWISYSSAIFVIQVKNDNDVYSLAYHYPYTYTDYQKFMSRVSLLPNFDLKCRRQLLCKTLSHNNCDLLTITAFDPESLGASPLDERKYIFLSSRVHPGETNSSFIIEGVIAFLLSDEATAIKLRSTCIFKIIPMLNPDGVINGSHRCSLAGVDLNRQWQAPMLKHHPTIYWAKKVLSHLVAKGKRPLLSCDFHGHSKRKNMFLFGCETLAPNDGLEKIFPQLMSDRSSLFDLSQCKYAIEKSKEATARVVIWRELGVVASYTLESTYCGIDIGPLKVCRTCIQLGSERCTGASGH